jgi:glycine hydroxymethyltransferase
MHIIAAKAVCFKEALSDEFKAYPTQIIKNAAELCKQLMSKGINIVSGGTDNHLMLVDLTSLNITGKEAEKLLAEAYGITVVCHELEDSFADYYYKLANELLSTQ